MPKIALPLSLLAVVLLVLSAVDGVPNYVHWYARFACLWAGWELMREWRVIEGKFTGAGGVVYLAAFSLVAPAFGWLLPSQSLWFNIVLVTAVSVFGLPLLIHYRKPDELPDHPDRLYIEQAIRDDARELQANTEREG